MSGGGSSKPGHSGHGLQSVREILGRSRRAYLNKQVTGKYVLAQLLARLKPGWFVQIHKSYAINRLHLQSYDTRALEATMKNGVLLPVSRRMMKRLKAEEEKPQP